MAAGVYCIFVQGTPTPKIPAHKSVLSIFNEEASISPVFKGFNKIIKSHDAPAVEVPMFGNFEEAAKKYQTLESIRNAPLPAYLKLALACKNQPDIFNTIKERFIDVFDRVEDIKLEPISKGALPLFFRDTPHLQIKEKNVSQWILHDRISSGMFKTLMQISQLLLCAEIRAMINERR